MSEEDNIRDVIAFLDPEGHRTRREKAVALGFCGDCCDVGHWTVKATVISVPPIEHVHRYGALKAVVCRGCAKRRQDIGCGYTTISVV